MKTTENQFIDWFNDNVRPNKFSFSDKRQFVGELNSSDFWIQPKARFLQNNPPSWITKEFNIINGSYELNEDRLIFNLTVQLENKHRNFFFFGIPFGIALSIYMDFSPVFSPLLFAGWLGYFGYLIWRVKQDTNFYCELLSTELKNDL